MANLVLVLLPLDLPLEAGGLHLRLAQARCQLSDLSVLALKQSINQPIFKLNPKHLA